MPNRAAFLSLSSSSSIMAVEEPCFFKLILAPRFDLQKLGLPSKFVQKYGGELLDGSVKLNIPTGEMWEVELVKKDSKVWLQKGWPKFVEFYSISHGHFLVFRYKGNAAFDVVIFDMSASEIEYPVFDIEACRKSMKRKRDTTNSNPPNSKKKVPEKVFGSRCDLTPDERKRVDNYQCKHPSFVVRLTPSHFKYNDLNIPLAFVRKYLKEIGRLKLVSVTGESLSSRCVAKPTHVKITKKWRHFAIRNKLQVGDICVFELINGTVKTLKVGILPAARKNAVIPQVKLEAD